ncbi:MAG TPA: UDP-N-acetylmuramoyl-L-alanine--D-glutamate ligase [Spirochaetota bacterium]|nr:UDP-N-acetylmuramoyl-L-alanine--D-glutamate ligase [Spirochaetota bacterium]
MDDDFQKVLVVGLGFRTGLASANFLAKLGKDVTVTDIKTHDELRDIIEKLSSGVKVIAGFQSPSILDEGFDLIVLSPGVPVTIPLIQEALKRDIPVVAEIELAYRYMKGMIIGITGTDGKSTTTSLTGHVLKELGFKAIVGGNIGIPLISLVGETSDDSVAVIELSSFQLETIDSFKPDVSSILNLTPDHLDRYNSMEDYFAAKKRIFKNQGDDDYFIYNADNEYLERDKNLYPPKTLSFSTTNESRDAFFRDNKIWFKREGNYIPVVEAEKLNIIGIHNIQNVMAALLMIFALFDKMGIKIDYDKVAQACYCFKGLEHRMEFAGVIKGRTFVNDSKATTIGAVEMAVKSIKDKGVLIIGGRTKGDDYTRLADVVRGKARAIVLIGESSELFAEIFKDFRCVRATNMEDAVAKALSESCEGDMILLSPACASFDMFSSYDERGKVFKACVKKLSEELN